MTPAERKRGYWLAIGIFLLALAVRLVYLVESADNPTFQLPTVDSETYDRLARTLAQGEDMSLQFFWQPFFYPFFLSLAYRLSHSSIIAAKVIQLLLGALTCVLTYWVSQRVFDRRVGVLAGVMVALYGPLIFFEGELLASGWAAFWSVVLVGLFILAGESKKLWLCFVLGACGALSIITRPTFLLFFLAGCLWLAVVFYRDPSRARLLAGGLAALVAGFVLIAGPVAGQNAKVTGRPGILPSSGGINLYIGNNPKVCETLTARPGWEWQRIASIPNRRGVTDMWEKSRFFTRRVVGYASTQPLGFVAGLGRKTLQFVSSREIPRNIDLYLFSKWSRVFGVLTWKAGGFGFPFGVLLPLALVGLIYFWRQVPGPVLLYLLLYPVAVILVFVTARYRVPVIPVVSMLSAAGVLATIRMFRNHQWNWVALAGGCMTGAVLLSSLPGPFFEERPDYEAELYRHVADALVTRERYNDAAVYYSQAVQLRPAYPEAHCNLGSCLFYRGEVDEAIAHYHEALRLKPDYIEPHKNLAIVLEQQGKQDEALKHHAEALRLERETLP